ncbi:MAG: SAM-dependent methyltransferase [Gammaproteobacteria bacterium]|nr:SAM-dependent methyltransferase [Gammaproteobacteria bacterium]RPG23361.1 MAG: class I SAM-dependent methyltransferase [Gammaproteobacteria bacterium TMED50]|tara:strand:+ start:75 stop:1301 length:1227 start_codon:yes stop_codon:yes gene_type:complete
MFVMSEIDRPLVLGIPEHCEKQTLLERMLQRVLPDQDSIRGNLQIRLPGGQSVLLGARSGQPATLSMNNWRAVTRILSRGPLGFAEGYMAGDWDTDSLQALLDFLGDNVASRPQKVRGSTWQRVIDVMKHRLNRNSKRGSRRNIAYHYDLGNDFYAKWLDSSMSYSAAIFESPDDTLEVAQRRKYDHLCQLADVEAGHEVLEIGCGWGGLLEALDDHGCSAKGISISREQVDYASQRLADRPSVSPVLQDYRDETGSYDRVLSIEMFEAVGMEYWDTFAANMSRLLAPGGVAGMQVITMAESGFDSYMRNPDFIQRYIFPGGMLPTVTHLTELMNRHEMKVSKVVRFGKDYARTLDMWRDQFNRQWEDIQQHGFDERFRRMWNYYLCYCITGFMQGITDVVQIRIEKS